MNENDLQQLSEQIEDRISQMENKEYEFPKRFSAKDYVITLMVVVICFAFIIYGAFLN